MTNPQPRVVVAVDGNSLAHRAFHAYAGADLHDDAGRPVGLLYGFCALLAGVAGLVTGRHGAITHLVVGLDDPARSARRERYGAYKASRSPKDPALVAQLARLPDLLGDLGLAVACPGGGEADDVLAAVARLRHDGHETGSVVLATSDRDALAHAHDGVEVLLLANGIARALWMDDAAVADRFGVGATRYVELAALRGDDSDNLPGVPGVGPKRAAQIVTACSNVRAVLGGAPSGLGARVDAAVAGARELVERNLDLMAPDASVHVALDECALAPADVVEVGRRWQITGAAARLAQALALPAGDPTAPPPGPAGDLQPALF